MTSDSKQAEATGFVKEPQMSEVLFFVARLDKLEYLTVMDGSTSIRVSVLYLICFMNPVCFSRMCDICNNIVYYICLLG